MTARFGWPHPPARHQHVFVDHDAPVVLARFSPTGAFIASVDADCVLRCDCRRGKDACACATEWVTHACGKHRLWVPPSAYNVEGKIAPGTPTLVTAYKAQLPTDIASAHWDAKADRLVRFWRRIRMRAVPGARCSVCGRVRVRAGSDASGFGCGRVRMRAGSDAGGCANDASMATLRGACRCGSSR